MHCLLALNEPPIIMPLAYPLINLNLVQFWNFGPLCARFVSQILMSKWLQLFATNDLCSMRNAYIYDKQSTAFDPASISCDPLSTTANNPWDANFKDMQLKEIIARDTQRIFPELKLFRQDWVQELIKNVLFVWCKVVGFADEHVQYRQGMHEIAAVILYALVNDENPNGITLDQDSVVDVGLNNVDDLEGDVFIIFKGIMHNISYLYSFATEQPIAAVSQRIFRELKEIDYPLYRHLLYLKIEPQLFCIRWLRLLFCREFTISQTIIVWNSILDDFEMINWIAIQMLLRIKSELMDNDYNAVMQLLMKYPAMSDRDVQELVNKAKRTKGGKSPVTRLENTCRDIEELENELVDFGHRLKLRNVRAAIASVISDLSTTTLQ